MTDPRNHHVIPQFVLRNFAVDTERTRIETLAKEGSFAVWAERSIKGIGYERDFYVHMRGGKPVSVETEINKRIETPISQSDTWTKIMSGRADALDNSDRAVLYSLVRHLEVRTPHYLETGNELMALAANPSSHIPFTDEERAMYAVLRANPYARKAFFDRMALRDFAEGYDRSLIMVMRSRLPLRSSTTPVLAAPIENMPGIALPLPGLTAFQRMMAVGPHTAISVVDGDFGGAFLNFELTDEGAMGFNRMIAGQFAKFPMVRHMICGCDRLVDDMIRTPFCLVRDSPRRIIFKRRSDHSE